METRSSNDTEERSKCTTYSSQSLKKRKLDVKFISRAESIRESGCNVFFGEQRTGKPVRELFFKNSLIRQIWDDLFLKEMKITCLLDCRSRMTSWVREFIQQNRTYTTQSHYVVHEIIISCTQPFKTQKVRSRHKEETWMGRKATSQRERRGKVQDAVHGNRRGRRRGKRGGDPENGLRRRRRPSTSPQGQ